MKLKTNMYGLMMVVAVMACGIRVNAQDSIITKEELPKPALDFLSQNFSAQKVIQVTRDTDYMVKTEYEAVLDNAAKIEFDGDGNWKEIDGNHNPIPPGPVPQKIKQYIDQNFSGQKITQIEKNSRKYDVEISNGLELEFTPDGKFIRIDD
ncbi:PepSY-like domain-containing protein [Sinomicrobium weinanense]|uniref:PepSY-like domain-containing protein n=1 Tax=Sinomicrobium weinanense TaxID=2842200 RepID=A0A926Q2S1_9FLAO|nr:PepSY-like domain-containing protein [Sinomicrobium weinanense]MBC9796134.1 PepSY-like domain-containing protein [Sinomicrobium weinanense]MBU3121885.1 PepSY-like domain-containing protein [Sinomicrobium weinanense]